MYKWKKDGFEVVRKAVPKELAVFLTNYMKLKREVHSIMRKQRYLSTLDQSWGTFGDPQIPNSYATYGDLAMETLMLKCQPILEKVTKIELVPTYAYARIYQKGDELKRHKDRMSCEISTTVNLGGSQWPIYIDPNPKGGTINVKEKTYTKGKNKGVAINLEPGDILIYQGIRNEHWREPLQENDCIQVFLHYNTAKSKNNNMYDGRPCLALPDWFKGK
jgi:hypothetical protein|tara:strand:- start:3138 stop:3794 length:657 start_codon:yes stop_codon:yes gene_type:complete